MDLCEYCPVTHVVPVLGMQGDTSFPVPSFLEFEMEHFAPGVLLMAGIRWETGLEGEANTK